MPRLSIKPRPYSLIRAQKREPLSSLCALSPPSLSAIFGDITTRAPLVMLSSSLSPPSLCNFCNTTTRAPLLCCHRCVVVVASRQGGFIPEGRHDILAGTIRRPEHHGRMRGARSGVGIRQLFGSSSRQSSCSHGADNEQRMKEMITAQVREELMRHFKHYGICSLVDQFVPPMGKFVFYKL